MRQILAALIASPYICADCAGLAAGVPTEAISKHIDRIGAHIRVAMRRGACLACERLGVVVIAFDG